jgi:DNA-binding beta-propeller fold protein YncE
MVKQFALLLCISIAPAVAVANQQLWLSDTTKDVVHVLDGASGSYLGEPVAFPAHQPLAPLVSRSGAHVYVQSLFGPIADIDPSTQSITQTFDDPNPDAVGIRTMTISPDGQTLYATGPGSATVAFVDTTTGEIEARVDIAVHDDASPLLRASHDGQTIFLLDSFHGTIATIDVASRTLGPTVAIPLEDSSDALVWMTISEDDDTLYTATKLGNVVRVDARAMSIAATTKIASSISGFAVAPHGGHAFATTTDADCLIDIDLATGATTSTAVADNRCSFPMAPSDDGSGLFLVEKDSSGQTQLLLGYDTGPRGVRFDRAGYDYIAFDDQSLSHGPIVPATGIWWNPQESGRSFQIEVQHGELVLIATGYASDGSASWQVASGAYDPATATFHSESGHYTGGQCFGCPYRSPDFEQADAADVSLVFLSATNAMLTWDGHTIPIAKYGW